MEKKIDPFPYQEHNAGMKIKEHLRRSYETIFGRRLDGTRIFPITTKIVLVFTLFILASNLTTNYINLEMNRQELLKTTRELLVKDLKELYTYANNQYEIFQYTRDRKGSLDMIRKRALDNFKQERKKSIALGINTNRGFLFQASRRKPAERFGDKQAFARMQAARDKQGGAGFIDINFRGDSYFAVFKYNSKWDMYLVRAEELNEFYANSRAIFWNISLISLLITIAVALAGIFLLRYILRFLRVITTSIMEMSSAQRLEIIELKGASNDDVTFLGVAFNSLSSTINNLLQVFRKFVNKDVALKAYQEKEVRLEGTRKDLTCLFSDIKRFTYMTETLGTNIINLLNLHYDRAIHEILNQDGIIGSIIGDALLAVYGALDESRNNKSWQAIASAYKIQEVAQSLRKRMTELKNRIEKKMGQFSSDEEKVYEAVLIEVGVGIDGGQVFYGNIGSNERMTNTVIGDNVNSASRLEGLTRVYHVPVICSEYVKQDVEKNLVNHGITFLELDTVQVKGKTIGKKVYWPIPETQLTRSLKQQINLFSSGLEQYYAGKWRAAEPLFRKCKLELAETFLARIEKKSCPKDWKGIWTMRTK